MEAYRLGGGVNISNFVFKWCFIGYGVIIAANLVKREILVPNDFHFHCKCLPAPRGL